MRKGLVALSIKSAVLLTSLLGTSVYGQSFQDVFESAEKFFQPVAKELRKEFRIEIKESDSLSAEAQFDGEVYSVTVSQSLLKNSNVDADTLRIIICHEVGHLFGGSPRRSLPFEWTGPIASDGLSFLTSEGQADYYATASCFRKLAKGTLANQPVRIPEFVVKSCETVWKSGSEESKLCSRASIAAKKFLQLVHPFPIDFNTPDLTVTDQLIRNQYPSRQCRLDTLLRGALCQDETKLVFDFIESKSNGCKSNPNFERPSCWYK